MNFISDNNFTLSETLKDICEKIILYEFGITLDSEGCITFERNSKKQNFEYVQEILELNGELMSVDEILNELIIKYREMDFQESQIRACLREKEIFIFIGRCSTYGLKKWESVIDGIKGGTIRDIVEEFLNKFDEPKHISEITNYVNQYRDTNERNVDINIQMEVNNRFVFFNAGFVGLRDKNYSMIDTNYKKVNGNWFILEKLKAFNNLHYDEFITKLANLYGIRPIQIKAIIDNKIENKLIRLTNEKKINIP